MIMMLVTKIITIVYGVEETIETFRADDTGSNPMTGFCFLKILINLKWQKRDDPMSTSMPTWRGDIVVARSI